MQAPVPLSELHSAEAPTLQPRPFGYAGKSGGRRRQFLRIRPVTRVSVAPYAGGCSHCVLASARGDQHFVKSCIVAEFCQQRIGKQIFVRAIVLLDRALEHMESRLFLATEREQRSLVVPRLALPESSPHAKEWMASHTPPILNPHRDERNPPPVQGCPSP